MEITRKQELQYSDQILRQNKNFNKGQGKLEVVKQEMARVNVDILGVSELKWTGMGEFYYMLVSLIR